MWTKNEEDYDSFAAFSQRSGACVATRKGPVELQ